MSSCFIESIFQDTGRQLSLFDFVSRPDGRYTRRIMADPSSHERMDDGKWRLDYRLEGNSRIVLAEALCPACDSPLIKNGFNTKKVWFPKKNALQEVELQRYRCPDCGEVKMDYTSTGLSPSKYPVEFPQEARLYWFLGFTLGQIQKIFIVSHKTILARSTIQGWVQTMCRDSLSLMNFTRFPLSSTANFDELYLRVNKDKAYAFILVDSRYRFITRAKLSAILDSTSVYWFFKALPKRYRRSLQGLTTDGAVVYAKLRRSPFFQHLAWQLCLVHLKALIRDDINDLVFSKGKSTKNLPPIWVRYREILYSVVDAPNEFEFIWRCFQADSFRGHLKKKGTLAPIRRLVASKEKILAHTKLRGLHPTNNLVESINRELQYYPSLKRGMKTFEGAEFALALGVLRHNYRVMSFAAQMLAQERAFLEHQRGMFGLCTATRSLGMTVGFREKCFRETQTIYKAFWLKHFPSDLYSLFLLHWKRDH